MLMKIEKILSRNDLGLTGTHQAGILVPKQEEFLSFFPSLNPLGNNPRVKLRMESQDGSFWDLNYIYYNNKLRGGTRNEYRLTGMTRYLKTNNLKPNDILIIEEINGDYFISYKRGTDSTVTSAEGKTIIKLNSWTFIG